MTTMDHDTRPCPVCGEQIKVAAIKCRFCNTDLVARDTAREAEVERELFVGHPAAVTSVGQWVLVVLTLGIAYLALWIRSRALKYTITTQRVRMERGLLSKTTDNVELFRIDDFGMEKPFGMRLLGHSRLHLRSSDPSFPAGVVYGIPNLESLADTLRECSLRERMRRRVTTFVEA